MDLTPHLEAIRGDLESLVAADEALAARSSGWRARSKRRSSSASSTSSGTARSS